MTYEIQLPQYTGPFDLLLFFIERDELDIYDIPIAKITEDFLGYVKSKFPEQGMTSKEDIELASEFILVAATLMRIKVKMLLPRKELDEAGNEIDPRDELVQKLLEYKKFKAVIEDLQNLESLQSKKIKRGNVQSDLQNIIESTGQSSEAELINLDLFKLLSTFKKVFERMEERERKIHHKVVHFPYTIDEEKSNLIDRLKKMKRITFEQTFGHVKDKVQAIFLFLGMLELIQQAVIQIKIGEGVNNFWLVIQEK